MSVILPVLTYEAYFSEHVESGVEYTRTTSAPFNIFIHLIYMAQRVKVMLTALHVYLLFEPSSLPSPSPSSSSKKGLSEMSPMPSSRSRSVERCL